VLFFSFAISPKADAVTPETMENAAVIAQKIGLFLII
jgi:hypothetical protein